MKVHYVPAILVFDGLRKISYRCRIRHIKLEHFDSPRMTNRSELCQCRFAFLNRTTRDDNMLGLLGNQK